MRADKGGGCFVETKRHCRTMVKLKTHIGGYPLSHRGTQQTTRPTVLRRYIVTELQPAIALTSPSDTVALQWVDDSTTVVRNPLMISSARLRALHIWLTRFVYSSEGHPRALGLYTSTGQIHIHHTLLTSPASSKPTTHAKWSRGPPPRRVYLIQHERPLAHKARRQLCTAFRAHYLHHHR